MYSYKNIINRLKNNNIVKVVLGIVSVWLFGAVFIYLLENSAEGGTISNIKDSLWWVIVTMTTVGYGDFYPTSDFGRILAILIMFSGIILIAIITATISSKVITRKIMEGKGLEKINLIDHILICGWNNNIINLINRLVNEDKHKNYPIILVNDQPQNEVDNLISSFSSLKFVRGDYSIDSILEKANIIKAKYALILNDNRLNEDEKVIMATLAIKKLSRKIKVIAQINDKSKAPFLKRANADVVLTGDDYTSFMAISNILEPTTAQVINSLIDINSNSSITSKNIPSNFIGKSFKHLHNYFFSEKGYICIGLYNIEESVGISDILSSDNSVLDKFIEKKLMEAGHSLNEQNKLNLMLNPEKNLIIKKGQGALIIK